MRLFSLCFSRCISLAAGQSTAEFMRSNNVHASAMIRFAGFAFLLAATVCRVEGISVPTGKETGDSRLGPGAVSVPEPDPARELRAPAPVFEYTEENPEPPPLHPSYTPATVKYLNALTPNAIYFVPLRVRVPDYASVDSFEGARYKPTKVLRYEIPSRNRPLEDEYRKVDPYQAKTWMAKSAFNKEYLYRRPTKGGYPKKATAHPDYTKYYQYLHQSNQQ